MSRFSPRSPKGVVALGVALLLTSTVASGLPWDIDMSDGQQVKAYERDMGTLPEGVVSQPPMNAMTARSTYAPNYPRDSAAAEALVSPLEATPDTIATGKQMFTTYCAPCHGDGVNLGAVAGPPPNRIPGVSVLAGANGVARTRSDGYLYTTIRNGGNVMPSYGWAMNDREIWSTVAYVRTMDNAAYAPPAPSGSGATP